MSIPRVLAETDLMLSAIEKRPRDGWSPHTPHPKQVEFLKLNALDVLYGGAAGGGKSDALILGALQYVDRPGYAALLLRRTFSDLALPGAIMDRAKKWLKGTRAHWNDNDKRYTFPSGAVLQFGYCNCKADLERYKSAEFQYVGIDELTEWPEAWALFLFSRLRRLAGVDIPIRFRAGTNPDGIGAGWVRQRYSIPESVEVRSPIWTGAHRCFFPARAEDNPSLDLPAYELSLEQMTGGRAGVRWKQLRWGLWVRDEEGMVYAFDKDRNVVVADVDGEVQRGVRWRFILGIDYGYSDETAYAVIGWREHETTAYVVHTEKHTQLLTDDAAQIVATLEQRYKFDAIIGDTGGMGKTYAEEARRRYKIPVEPADKNNKRGYIRLFNDALRMSQIMLVKGATDELVTEYETLPWAEGKQKEHDGFANHIADATLYAWRSAWAFAEQPPPKDEEKSLADAVAEEEERLARELDRSERKKDRSWARRMAQRR